ncbi:MAG: 50S ribosomal protein L15 [Acidobacteria bacterium]|nr:50S ribosomal protein L15 [Acidobacteriota bacterium]MBI1983952.1 50S ribosomal protein L15 [Acidobacteriota bacterium]
MTIHVGTLRPPRGARKRRKRIGFGMGSGHGKTATRGSKGQRSRAGSRMRPGFEGGQMPLHRRLPKRGFTNIFKKQFALVNLSDLEDFTPEETVTPELLTRHGLVKKLGDGVKVLGDGELRAPLKISAHRFSKSALEKIKKAGGTAEVISA